MQAILRIVSNQPTEQVIPEIVEYLHGNPKYPKKQNIFMTRVDSDVTIVFGGTKEKTWHTVPKHYAMNKLRSEAMNLLTHKNRPMTNFRLIEAAHDAKYKDTEYQDKIAVLATDDVTNDDSIAQKLVDFGEIYHN